MTSETIEGLVQQFRTNRTRFQAFCFSLSDEELERPVPNSTYRVKDFASHLATLDTELIRWFEAVREGKADEPRRSADGSPFDVDKWNDAAVAERRDWSLTQIFDEAAENRTHLLEALRELEDEHINQIVHFAGDNKRPPADIPFKLFLAGLSRHDPIHVADMLKALPEHAHDPELQAWLDDPAVKWYQDAMAGPPKR
jgi:Mycothiol maleylpyruvate isomerase N-terminal domain